MQSPITLPESSRAVRRSSFDLFFLLYTSRSKGFIESEHIYVCRLQFCFKSEMCCVIVFLPLIVFGFLSVLSAMCRHVVSLTWLRKLASCCFMFLIISHSASGFSGASFVAIVSPEQSIVLANVLI